MAGTGVEGFGFIVIFARVIFHPFHAAAVAAIRYAQSTQRRQLGAPIELCEEVLIGRIHGHVLGLVDSLAALLVMVEREDHHG